MRRWGIFNFTWEDTYLSVITVGASRWGSISVTLTLVISIMTKAVGVKTGGGVVVANHTHYGDEAEGVLVGFRRCQCRETSGGPQGASEYGSNTVGHLYRNLRGDAVAHEPPSRLRLS